MQGVEIGVAAAPFCATATTAGGTTATGTVTPTVTSFTSDTGRIINHYQAIAITHFSGSCSVSATYQIESPSGTIKWQKDKSAATNDLEANFDPPIVLGQNAAAVFKAVSGAVGNGKVNLVGYYVVSG